MYTDVADVSSEYNTYERQIPQRNKIKRRGYDISRLKRVYDERRGGEETWRGVPTVPATPKGRPRVSGLWIRCLGVPIPVKMSFSSEIKRERTSFVVVTGKVRRLRKLQRKTRTVEGTKPDLKWHKRPTRNSTLYVPDQLQNIKVIYH